MRRLVGKFAFLLAGIYLLVLFGVAVSSAAHRTFVIAWVLLLLPAAAFVVAVIDGFRLHRTARRGGNEAVVAALLAVPRDRRGVSRRSRADGGEDDTRVSAFRVEPQALRTYAGQLAEGEGVADVAKNYVHQYGDFSLHDKGLLGLALPFHRDLLAALNKLLGRLNDLVDTSSRALTDAAARYEKTDLRAASAIDATYPPLPRPSPDIH